MMKTQTTQSTRDIVQFGKNNEIFLRHGFNHWFEILKYLREKMCSKDLTLAMAVLKCLNKIFFYYLIFEPHEYLNKRFLIHYILLLIFFGQQPSEQIILSRF